MEIYFYPKTYIIVNIHIYIYLPKIAGDANEHQILTAARYYYDRPMLLTRVSVNLQTFMLVTLNYLFNLGFE